MVTQEEVNAAKELIYGLADGAVPENVVRLALEAAAQVQLPSPAGEDAGSGTLDWVLDRLRSACERDGSQRAWANKAQVSEAYVSDVLQRRREPGIAILEPLGLHTETTYHVTGMAPREQFRKSSAAPSGQSAGRPDVAEIERLREALFQIENWSREKAAKSADTRR